MKNTVKFVIPLLFLAFIIACSNSTKSIFKIDEVSPWCIIGFDSLDRSPEQRINMLKLMGFTKYGFNKGKGDLTKMKEEFKLAHENNIEISSIFLWLNAKRDSVGKLSPSNQKLLTNLSETDCKPTIWVSFSNNFFEELNQEQSIELSIAMIEFVKLKANKLGCKLALYNHHGWFGNPYNQVEILKRLNQNSITMVYNFHHAHEYVEEFPEIVKKIKPYLSHVNISGVKKEGPQILTLGKGEHEFEMIEQLLNEGFNGPWGILGHVKNKDVQKVLKQNIEGLNLLNSKFNLKE